MSLDDSLRGVLLYAVRVGWPQERKEELRQEYRRAERLYEKTFPQPNYNKDNPTGYQARLVEWLRSRELIAANMTRTYIRQQTKVNKNELFL